MTKCRPPVYSLPEVAYFALYLGQSPGLVGFLIAAVYQQQARLTPMCRMISRIPQFVLLLFFTIATASALSASGGYASHKFTGIGFAVEGDFAPKANLMPAVSLITGKTGLLSYFGSIEAGYRLQDPAWMARGSVEFYLLFAGLYGGIQQNSSTGNGSDYGFPMGLTLGVPGSDYLARLHLGAIVYSTEHAHEFQASFAWYFKIW
jgi:hypothetical protein